MNEEQTTTKTGGKLCCTHLAMHRSVLKTYASHVPFVLPHTKDVGKMKEAVLLGKKTAPHQKKCQRKHER